MSNKIPPTPRVCLVCEDEFYGRPDALTCSNKCRKKKYRLSHKGKEENNEKGK